MTTHDQLPAGHTLDECLRAAFLPDAVDANYMTHTQAARYRELVQRFPNVDEAEETELDNLRETLGLPDPFAPDSDAR